jgi:GNAT superfamily N-acetyltransferase
MNEGLFHAPRKRLGPARRRHTAERDIGTCLYLSSFMGHCLTVSKTLVLDFPATLLAYRGRGIGSALLEWGIKIADTVKTRIYLEATSAGLSLYRKHGWQVVEELVLDLEPFGEGEEELFTLMLREPVLLDVP